MVEMLNSDDSEELDTKEHHKHPNTMIWNGLKLYELGVWVLQVGTFANRSF